MFTPDPISLLVDIIYTINKQVALVKGNKEQCRLLGTRLSHLQTILPQTEEEKARLTQQRYTHALNHACETANACLAHINRYVEQGYFKRLYNAGNDKDGFLKLNRQIDESQQLLVTAISVHQVLAEQKQTHWQQAMLTAQQRDQQTLKAKIGEIEILMRQQLDANLAEAPAAEQASVKVAQDQAIKHKLQKHTHAGARVNNTSNTTPQIAMDDLVFEALLAQGSFGSVYTGQWQGKPVAIKRINDLNETTRDALLREVKIMRRLSGPAITPFYGACLAHGFECLVMQRMEQGTLSEYLIANPSLDFDTRQALALRLLEGVTYLHSQGVVHRDLKAANIFMDNHQLHIGDFGLSNLKHSLSVQNLKSLPTPDVACAPELLQAAVTTDKVDTYSAGWLLWHILSGEAWPAPTAQKDYPALDKLHPDYQRIIQTCWDSKPASRPSAKNLLEQCRNIRTLETLFTQGQAQETSANYVAAKTLFQQAADLGHVKAAYSLGMLYASRRLPLEAAVMLAYLTKASDAGYYRAQYNLARVHEKGELISANAETASALYQTVTQNPNTPTDIRQAAQTKVNQLAAASGAYTAEVNLAKLRP